MATRDLEQEARADAKARAQGAVELLREAATRLDAVGLFGIGGTAREAQKKAERLLRWLAAATPEADHG